MAQIMLNVVQNHEKRAKIGPNNLFSDVSVILMTKKCTKIKKITTGSVKNEGGTPYPTLSPKIQGDSHPLSSP
jgi:hypothetical protein